MKLDDALFGKVISLQQGIGIDTLTLQIGGTGSVIAGVEHLNSYNPKAGDQVYYHVIHGVPWVLGVMGAFVPYPTASGATPVGSSAYWVAATGTSSGSTAALNIFGFAANGGLIGEVVTDLYVETPSTRSVWGWAAMHSSGTLLAIAGLSPGASSPGEVGASPQENLVNIYSLPSLTRLESINVLGGGFGVLPQAAITWDPAAQTIYVFTITAGTITAYSITGSVLAGPVTVSALLPGTPRPVITATEDGYVWMTDSTNHVACWTTGTLTPVGVSSALPALQEYVVDGDGSVDVLGGGEALGAAGGLYTVVPTGPTPTAISGAGSAASWCAPAVINSILWQLEAGTPNDFGGWNVGATPAALTPFSLLTGPVTSILGLTVALDGITGLALGSDGTHLYMVPFFVGGPIGAPVKLRTVSDPGTSKPYIWLASQYNAPAEPH